MMKEKKKKKKNRIIYKVENKCTGEVYVGATTKSIKKRKLDHLQHANRGVSGKFYNAIATYGPEAFSWTEIDTASSIDELALKEKKYVIQYDSKKNGYNTDSGGGFKKTVYQFSIENGNLISKYDSLESAANAVNANKKNISAACLGINKTCKGFVWSYFTSVPSGVTDMRKKKVAQFDLNEEYISEYASVSEASKATGINKSSIAKVCRGERKLAGGWKWQYQ